MIAVPIAEKIETAPKLNNTHDVNNSLEEEKEIVKPKKKKKVILFMQLKQHYNFLLINPNDIKLSLKIKMHGWCYK